MNRQGSAGGVEGGRRGPPSGGPHAARARSRKGALHSAPGPDPAMRSSGRPSGLPDRRFPARRGPKRCAPRFWPRPHRRASERPHRGGRRCRHSSSAPPAWSAPSSPARSLPTPRPGSTALTLVDVVAPKAPGGALPATTGTLDLTDAAAVAARIAERPEVIFHLAAVVSGEAEAELREGLRRQLRRHAQPLRGDPRPAGLPPARGLHLLDRRLRRALPRDDRRRVPLGAADQLRHAEGDGRAPAQRLFPPRLLRRRRHPAADGLHPPRRCPTRPPRASSPTSCASRWPARKRCCPVERGRPPLAREPARRGRLPAPRHDACRHRARSAPAAA